MADPSYVNYKCKGLARSAVVLLLGAVCYEGIRLMTMRRRKNRSSCTVTLYGEDGHSIRIDGLVDTGNSLTEPSKSPTAPTAAPAQTLTCVAVQVRHRFPSDAGGEGDLSGSRRGLVPVFFCWAGL
mgnify:CR=1 FL=1